MQSSNIMYGVPFKKNPRIGQARVFEKIYKETDLKKLNIKLPTGYGKTITAMGTYSILKEQGRVNRLLMIFPTNAQLEQFKQDGRADLEDCGVILNKNPCDIGFYGVNSIRQHKNNECQVFAISIQTLSLPRGNSVVKELLQNGRWMICVDEYHHYGLDKTWGKAVIELNYDFILAMSATPFRKDDDSAFGEPDIIITYEDAVKEMAVKPIKGHSYNYKLDTINNDGDVISYSTSELVQEAGSNSPEAIEKLLITRDMRWSPKYISPLVSIPIERMLRERIETGFKLQALISCMCVSHAKTTCGQVKDMYPELSVDWVGTGDNGRTPEENKSIIKKFCPEKDSNGKRHPTLDVLVHVGIAGEGLDTTTTSEVIKLHQANKNNSGTQEDGRVARFLDGVTGHVNFDSSSEYAKKGYVGLGMIKAMDDEDLSEDDVKQLNESERKERDFKELPEEVTLKLYDVSLVSIDSGDLVPMARVLDELNPAGFNLKELLENPAHPNWAVVENALRMLRCKQAERFNEESQINRLKEAVNNALSVVASRVIKLTTHEGSRFEKSLVGDIKRKINTMKKRCCGAITEDIENCKKHYQFLKNLEVEIIDKGVPKWLQ
jgi:superfamily II DNA or RNA helicase